MSFSDAQKVQVRKYCYFPAYGATPSPYFSSIFYLQAYTTLEWRMNNMTSDEVAEVTSQLANLSTLEAALYSMSASLDTAQAAVWTRNPQELQERQTLYTWQRLKLCEFFGIQPGPMYQQEPGRVINMVV